MDPNAALARIREELAALDAYSAGDDSEAVASHAFDLAELVTGLDGWLSKGGFLPTAWQAAAEGSLPDHLIAVQKDSCEAEHPISHLQCWLPYGHERDHMVADDRWSEED